MTETLNVENEEKIPLEERHRVKLPKLQGISWQSWKSKIGSPEFID